METQKLDLTKIDIDEIKTELQGDPELFRVSLFFSFDLSDSTEFKTEHPDLWSYVFTSFYTIMMRKLRINSGGVNTSLQDDDIFLSGMKLWKLIGDEVLVYVNITKWESLYEWIKNVSKVIENVLTEVAEEVIVKITLPIQEEDAIKLEKNKIRQTIITNLGVKGTAWIAAFNVPETAYNPNTIYRPPFDSEGQAGTDFLGRDIDEGFRIAKYAEKNHLIVSPLLAWLIYQNCKDRNAKDEEDFRITAYAELKGVWKRRKVPLIMFFYKFEGLEEKLDYDDIDKDIYKNIKELGFKKFLSDEKMQLRYIEKIMKSVHREEEARVIYESLKNKDGIAEDSFAIISNVNPQHELHIACVIFVTEDKVLIHKDMDEKKWEYGCANYVKKNIGDTWKDICEQEYASRYNLKITVSQEPIPFDTYNIDKKNRNILGILITGKYAGGNDEIPDGWEIADEERIKIRSIISWLNSGISNCFECRSIPRRT